MPFASLQFIEPVEMEMRNTWPKNRIAQVRALKHFSFYLKVLAETSDKEISMKKTMRRFGVTKLTLYRHFAFSRAYYDALDKS